MSKIQTYILTILISCLLTSCSNTTNHEKQSAVNLEQPQSSASQENDSVQYTPKRSGNGNKIYNGNWFDVEYPADFIAAPLSPVYHHNDITVVDSDEAYFTSPDSSVVFFVYSPQWSGNPKNYLELLPGEEWVSNKEEKSGTISEIEKRVIVWGNMKAKDGSYFRSFVSTKKITESGEETHHIFGIRYKNQAAYNKYKDAYLEFKSSLTQYGD